MFSINFAPKLPPTALLIPGALVALASMLLVALLLVQGRALQMSSLAAQAQPTLAAGDDAPLQPVAPQADLTQLASSDLFGHYDPAAAASEIEKNTAKPTQVDVGDKAPHTLPEATLALKVQGIVYKADAAQRRAIIAGDGPNPEARRIGETLLGDAVIRFIEPRRVVVEQQGELKALSLVEAVLGNGGAPISSTNTFNPGGDPATFVPSPPLSMRRGAIEAMPEPQPYEAPDEFQEPPPEEVDNSAQDYDSTIVEPSADFDQNQSTE